MSEVKNEITVLADVVEYQKKRERNGVWIEKCTVTEIESGIEIKDLPCAGMNLRPNEVVTITVRRAPKPLPD